MTVYDDDVDYASRPDFSVLVEALRQPARPDEHAGELEVVQAMAAIVATNGKGGARAPRSLRPKLAALAAAVALLVGGITAAAANALRSSDKVTVVPSDDPATPRTTVASATSTTAASTTTTATTAAPGTTAVPSPSTATPEPSTSADANAATDQGRPATQSAVTAPPCPAGVTNHGDYVSSVAHDTPPGPTHGQIVSAAAQSDCGSAGSPGASSATSAAAPSSLTADQAAPATNPAADHGSHTNSGNGKGGNGGNGAESNGGKKNH
jgi:hypothetical protein